jgi:hypothetical protein
MTAQKQPIRNQTCAAPIEQTRLTLTVSGQIGNATYSVALYFHIRRKHLSDQRFQPTQPDNQKLVFG